MLAAGFRGRCVFRCAGAKAINGREKRLGRQIPLGSRLVAESHPVEGFGSEPRVALHRLEDRGGFGVAAQLDQRPPPAHLRTGGPGIGRVVLQGGKGLDRRVVAGGGVAERAEAELGLAGQSAVPLGRQRQVISFRFVAIAERFQGPSQAQPAIVLKLAAGKIL